MNWISVKDRLPSIGEKVLVYTNIPYDEEKIIVTGWIESISENNYVFWTSNECIDLYGDVTHWMPLPEAPK